MQYRYIGRTDLILKSKKDEVQREGIRVGDGGCLCLPVLSCRINPL